MGEHTTGNYIPTTVSVTMVTVRHVTIDPISNQCPRHSRPDVNPMSMLRRVDASAKCRSYVEPISIRRRSDGSMAMWHVLCRKSPDAMPMPPLLQVGVVVVDRIRAPKCYTLAAQQRKYVNAGFKFHNVYSPTKKP